LLRLARDGYDLVVHCRSRRDEADAVAAEIRALGRAARCVRFDVADRDACAAALPPTSRRTAPYGVVCNAGSRTTPPSPR
jgi:3-oxoacyl-[acyl-carrier protein] reductase